MKRMSSAAAEALTIGAFGDDSPSRDLNAGVLSGELSPQRKRKVFSDYASPRRKKKIKANDGLRKGSVRASSPGKSVGISDDNSRGNGAHTADLPTPGGDLSPQRRGEVSNLEDLTPPRRRKQVSPVHDLSPVRKRKDDSHADDLSPPRIKKASSPEEDLSPPRRRPVTVSPRRRKESTGVEDLPFGRRRRESMIVADLSPPRRKESNSALEDISPPHRRKETGTAQIFSPSRRRKERSNLEDLSPPRRHGDSQFRDRRDFSSPRRNHGEGQFKDRREFSPPRRTHDDGVFKDRKDISPPRRVHDDGQFKDRRNMSPPRRFHDDAHFQDRRKFNRRDENVGARNLDRNEDGADVKKRMLDGAASGLRTDKEIKVDIERKRNAELSGLAAMDASQSGRGADTIYRDKRGKKLEGVEELLRQQEDLKKAEEKPLEWGKGLVQKREAEMKQQELEAEASKPFARSRDDPDLDKSLRERVRWGDPMAHIVKASEPELEDIGARENMKDSGFSIPQDVPPQSWIRRRIGPPPNRYGIKPGRHWDGVDRSNGFEQKMFKLQNEKRARDQEAYAWSVADM